MTTESAGPSTISGQESFRRLTGGEREIAGMYAYSLLDCLVDLACLTAADFFARPHLYTSLSDGETAGRLARLRSRVGHSEYYPSPAQRRAMFDPLFGATRSSDFTRLRDGLLTAAATYAEWSQATGIPMLLERIRTAHRPFREYLSGVAGASVAWSRTEALPTIADAESYAVLRDGGVIAVFGLTRPPVGDWPYREDANGDKVVEEIGKHLEARLDRRLTREGFSAVQRAALRGSEALAAIIDFDESQGEEALNSMITRCYTWHAALRTLEGPGGNGGGLMP